jgi:phage terminase small subunit
METSKTAFDSLNDKQKEFVLNYIKSRVATTAYLEAYSTDKKKLSYEVAGANACRMLKDAKIQEAIRERINAIWESREKEIGSIFDEFRALGFSDINDLLEMKDGVLTVKDFDSIDTRAIKKIKIREERSSSKKSDETETTANIIEIELHDKKGSLAELADILGLKKQQIELTGNSQIVFNHKPVTTVEKADEQCFNS